MLELVLKRALTKPIGEKAGEWLYCSALQSPLCHTRTHRHEEKVDAEAATRIFGLSAFTCDYLEMRRALQLRWTGQGSFGRKIEETHQPDFPFVGGGLHV